MSAMNLLKELIAINSVNPFKTVVKDGKEIGIGNEEKIAEYLENKLIASRFNVKRQIVQEETSAVKDGKEISVPKRYNLLASKGAGNKSLLFIGHMDTVDVKEGWKTNPFEAMRIADLAAKYKIQCQMGSMLENAIGCAHSIHAFLSHPNITTAELSSFSRLQKCIGSGVTLNKDQTISIKESPGLGISVQDDEIKEFMINESDSITFRNAREGFNVK